VEIISSQTDCTMAKSLKKMVVQAVCCEPVSGTISLKSGNLLGKKPIWSPQTAAHAAIPTVIQSFIQESGC
jgi:hypothetical protein